MGSLTTWNRLEPRTRSAALPGLAARVGDLLWLLGTQRRSGEPTGSDTASIVSVRMTYEIARLTRWTPGGPAPGEPGAPYPDGVPIERRDRPAAGAGRSRHRAPDPADVPRYACRALVGVQEQRVDLGRLEAAPGRPGQAAIDVEVGNRNPETRGFQVVRTSHAYGLDAELVRATPASAPCRARTRRAVRAMASSTISPSKVTAPVPSRCAASTAAISSAQRASSSGPGENTSLITGTWEGWIAIMPS